MLIGNPSRFLVYSGITDELQHPPELENIELNSLTHQDLRSLEIDELEFKNRQLERLDRFSKSYAHGVFIGSELAHISWLLPSQAMEKDVPRVLVGGDDEAEITCCETLASHRGKGLYMFAILSLARIAREQGIQRIYMKTSPENLPSQGGILKAGLKYTGSTFVWTFPISGKTLAWPRQL
jgi:hypothetical protein